MDLIEPKEVEILGKTFIISKFPAVLGREIITQYPTSAAPKVGDYRLNEELMFKLLCHVGIPMKGKDPLLLTTRALVDNHIKDWEMLMKVEWAMMEFNCSFFTAGRMSGLLELILSRAEGFIASTLTSFVQSLSEKDSQPSKN